MKRKKKHLRRLFANHLWVPLFAFVVVAILTAFTIILFADFITSYITSTKISSGCASATYLAKMIDRYDTDEWMHEEGEEEYTYVLTDISGNIIRQSGTNTCSYVGGKVDSGTQTDNFAIYSDNVYDFITVDEENDVSIDYLGLLNYSDDSSLENNEEYDELLTDSSAGMSTFFGNNTKAIRLPYWISLELPESRLLLVKQYYLLTFGDLFFILGIVGLLALLAFAVLIVMIVNLVNSILRQRNTLKLFFTDISTKGHNWLWFQFNCEKVLQKRKNAGRTFAMVDLVLLNYNIYCICHSTSAGEAMLERINDELGKMLDKNELYAHNTSSSFAVLMNADDKELLSTRLREIIGKLGSLNPEHRFAFQAGVDIIGPDESSTFFHTRPGIDIDSIYSNACAARDTLSKSDEAGFAFFDEKLVEDKRWIDTVSDNQRKALEGNEFVVYYQPKYDPVTGELKGAEALIRWQTPEHGLIPPGRFIPIFEKNGFITEIDHYMIEHVAADQKRWLDEGYKCVPVSVNVSRAHFIEADLAEQIRDMVDKAGAPRELIEIELTESAFFDDQKQIIATIKQLKEYGFSVSMDDFGSGYSSLNSLKDMPLDVLKLDAEFFRGEKDKRSEIVVSEAIKLAQRLDMKTVAEGVEEKEQVDFLASLSCDMIQGYYFAKPMPVADFEERLKSGLA